MGFKIGFESCTMFNRVALYSIKIGIKKISSNHTHARSSFKNLIVRNPIVKTDLNSDAG